MNRVTVEATCCFCLESHETEVDFPDGWAVGSIYEGDALCPKHSKIAGFRENCSGCVACWGDCPLWKAFAYRECKLTESDFAIIRQGRCPKRVNGTMEISPGTGVRRIDISSPALPGSGDALADAILEYLERYPEPA